MAQIIAGLGAQLGLDTTEFKKGIGEAKKELKEFAEYLPEALSIAAFVEMTNKAMEFSNQIVETAKANDIATASVLELSKALQENGGDMEDTSRIYSGFTQKIEAAVQGNAKAQESFGRLGVTLNDLRTMSEQDLFSKTVKGLANMADAAERNGLAYMTLGKSIRGVDIKGLSETLEESRGEMDKYAHSIELAHRMSEQIKASTHNLLLEFTNAFIPTMAALYDHFAKTGDMMQKVFGYLKTGAQVIGIFVSAAVTSLEHFWSIIKLVGKDLYVLFDPREYFKGTFFETLNKNMADFTKEWSADADSYMKSLDEIKKANDETVKPKDQPAVMRKTTDALQKQLDKINQIAEAYRRQGEASLLSLESQLSANEATKEQKQMQDELMKVVLARNKALDEIDKQMAMVDKSVSGHERLTAALKKQKEQINDTYGSLIVKTQEAVLANQRLQDNFWYGWDKAFEQYKESAVRAADVGAQAFNSVISNMDSALSNFVRTGKLNFSNLAQSIIQDLIRIQITASANQAFASMGFGSAALMGFMGGGQYTPGSNSFVGPMPQVLGSAVGGPLNSGQPSIVGENGPELFIPRSSGTVIPNSGNLSGADLGSTTVNNYNINAIDTKSFEQRLYQSSGAIWAANQYAGKNLATNRSRV
jgi:lambda family phage tail tape measure protein